MITMAKPDSVASRVLDRLDALHHHRRSRRLRHSLVWTLALVMLATAAAVTLDAIFGWWSLATRVTISSAVLILVLGWLFFAIRRTFRRDDSVTLASFADMRTPIMQERMQTLISVSQRATVESGVDRIMLGQVAAETDELIDQFDPRASAEESSFRTAWYAIALGIGIWILLALRMGSDLSILVGRLIAPTSSLTRFQVDGIPGDVVVAKGEPFHLELTGKRSTQNAITLQRRFEAADSIDSPAVTESIELVSEDRQFQFRERRSDDSFDYRVQVGDLQTSWNHVTVAARPRVQNVSLIVTPPEYSHLPPTPYSRMPNRLTVIEGSRIELSAKVSGEVELAMVHIEGETPRTMLAQTNPTGEQTFVASIQATKEMNLELEVQEKHGLKNLSKPKCQILTRPDLPPSVRLDSPSPDQQVRPDDTIELQFTAKDDVGLARAKLIVQIEQDEPTLDADGKPMEPEVLEAIDIPVPKSKNGDGKPLTNWTGRTKLDLSKFELKEGQTLTYRVEVFDTKQAEILESMEAQASADQSDASSESSDSVSNSMSASDAESETEDADSEQPTNALANQDASSGNTSGGEDTGESQPTPGTSKPAEDMKPGAESSKASSSTSEMAKQSSGAADDSEGTTEPTAKESDSTSSGSTGSMSPSEPSETEPKASQPSDSEPSNSDSSNTQPSNTKPSDSPAGSSNPSDPNPMQMRSLDLPQPSSSEQRRLKVTETVGSFVSESRRKSEVEIARTFQVVETSLQAARKSLSDILNDYESSGAIWNERHSLSAIEAHQELERAIASIKDLIQRTKETPYAFIGLQLAEIAHTHIMPAREDAKSATESSGETQWALVTASRQQVIRALERLQSLYKTYEKAKEDFKTAKNIQEIEKMYRVYLEDALAELTRAAKEGDGTPGLERTMAELDIDEDYLARLKEVLEMQRDLRAELAKILADDPRLMRRYFQNFGQNGRSIRDQLYDLAKAQRSHFQRTESYGKAIESGDANRMNPVIADHSSSMAIEAMDLVEQSLEIEETFETWLPLDEKETPSIRAARDAFLNISVVAGDVTTAFESETASKVFAAQGDITEEELKTLLQSSANAMSGLATALDGAAATLADLSADEPDLIENATRRVIDLQQLHSSVARWGTMASLVSEKQFLGAIAVAQVDTANQTHDLTEKLTGLQGELARQLSEDNTLPQPIATASDELLRKLDQEIEPLQLASIRALQQSKSARALQRLEASATGLDEACKLMDEVLKQVIALLDKLPPDPMADLLDDPTLDEILAQLEQERAPAESLGIPLRPTNLQVVNDWANGKNGPGGAARMRLLQMIQGTMNAEQKKRLQQLTQTREKLLARHANTTSQVKEDDVKQGSVFGWNVLRSRLGGSLLQESDGLPPESYRSSIERYFEIISSAAQGQ